MALAVKVKDYEKVSFGRPIILFGETSLSQTCHSLAGYWFGVFPMSSTFLCFILPFELIICDKLVKYYHKKHNLLKDHTNNVEIDKIGFFNITQIPRNLA